MRTGPAARGLEAARTLRVLLLEDSAADAELTVELLSDAMPGLEVTLAGRLDEALAAAACTSFDVTLADLQLPDASGLETLQALRRPGVHPGAVVVLTGVRQDELAEHALAAGAQDYLVKQDLSSDALARAVRYAVSRARAEQEASRSQQWAQSVLDSIEAPTCALDASGTIVATNVAWRRFAEQNGAEPARSGPGVDYLAVCEAAGDAVSRRLADDLRTLLRDGTGRVELEYPCQGPDSRRWFSLRATPVAGGGAAVVTHLDVTALKQAQEDLGHAARHDPLTGLANRRLLVEDLDRRLADPSASRAVAVLFLDLDRFKLINDSLGHTAGDGVLVRVAAELHAAVRAGDLVARHGGDEFVVVAEVADEAEAAGLADRLQTAASVRLRLDGTEVDVAASSGLVVSRPGSGATADEILQAVDAAMHEAKDSGRGRVQVYSDDLRQRARARAVLYRELAVAVEQDQFVLHYQPIVVPGVGGMHAVEALVRWEHPQRGLLAPGDFLDVAESTGLIVPIGRRVIEAACRQGRQLHDDGLHLSVSVNLSAKQLREPEAASVIEAALARSGFPAHSLIVEVTETTMLDDTDAALASMLAIKELGVQLAVDDFGTGYSSLSYIRRYPVDGLKVDRSFVRDLVHSSDDRAIVGSLIRLAKELDLWVVAEGVETAEQLAALRDMGCELVQGFLYARPMPPEELHEAVHLLAARVPLAVPAPRSSPDAARAEAEAADPVVTRRIVEMTAQGASLHTIAAALNAEGCRTAQGLRWHPRSVARALSQDQLVG